MMNEKKELVAEKRIAVDVKELQKMLGLGRASADSIGEKAGAVIRVGTRKLYNVARVEEYINSITNQEEKGA